MRKIKIVSDSSSDLLTLETVAFSYTPLKIATAEREFVDNGALDVDEMVDYLGQYKGKSKSSCPNTGEWLEAFGDADDIVCVKITSGLSGSYNSACAAKQIYEAEREGSRGFVIDSRSTGPEMVLILQKLAECVEKGMQYESICIHITQYLQKTGLLFMLKSLKTLANNGRVSPIVAKIVGIAGICMIGKASEEGTLEQMHKCRGESRALETLVHDLETEGFRSGKISIGHCQNEGAAQRLRELISQKFQNVQIEIHQLRGLCSFYAESGGILVGFEKV